MELRQTQFDISSDKNNYLKNIYHIHANILAIFHYQRVTYTLPYNSLIKSFFQSTLFQETKMKAKIKIVTIKKSPIRLGQFLKFANIAQDGLEAKVWITRGNIKVNGTVETQRGKQLQNNDQVTVQNNTWVVKQE